MRRSSSPRRVLVAAAALAVLGCDQPATAPATPLASALMPEGVTPGVSAAIRAGGPGRIIAFHDEWALANHSFELSTGSPQFARNVARFLAGGRAGRFLAWSDNVGLRGDSVAATMRAAGHVWVNTQRRDLTLDDLEQFDAVFVGGGIVPPAALLDAYVQAGGGVYVLGGTGETPGASPAHEAAHWNAFLHRYGIEFAPEWNQVSGVYAYATADSLLEGVAGMFEGIGQSLSLVTPAVEGARMVEVRDGIGVLAVWQASGTPVASFAAPAAQVEGDVLALDGSSSLRAESYLWRFEDGSTARGARVSRALADDGTARVTLVVTARDGKVDSLTREVPVANAAPVVTVGALAPVVSGSAIAPAVSFGDRGARDATWRGRVRWSDLPARSSSQTARGAIDASRTVCGAGTRTLTVAVSDKDGAQGEASTTVEVLAVPVGIDVQHGDAVGSIKLGPQGPALLPVVVWGARTTDVRALDVAALRLGDGRGPGTPVALKNSGTRHAAYADVNGDGYVDLDLKFERRALVASGDLSAATTSLSLTGTSGGCAAVSGSDVVRVIP